MTTNRVTARPQTIGRENPQTTEHATVGQWSIVDLVAVIFLAVLAGALRLWRLGDWGFYYDELYTVDHTLHIRWHTFYGLPIVDYLHREIRHVPLTPLLMRVVFSVAGVSEGSARLVQAVFGIAAPPVFYLLFTHMSSRWLGVIGALLMAVSPWHIYHSQEARYYSVVFFFAGVAACAFYLGLERDSRGWMFVSVLCLVLALLTHTAAVFVGAALVAYPLALWLFRFERPPGLRGRTLGWFFVPCLLSAILLLPTLGYVLFGWGLGYAEPSYSASHIAFALGYNFGPPLLLLAFCGAVESLRRRERLGLFASLLAAIPLLLLLAATFLLVSGMGPRYLVCALPAYFLLAASGGAHIVRPLCGASRWLSAGVAALLVSVQVPLLLSYYKDGDRADYRRAAAFLKENARSTDLVLAPQSPYTLEYYLHRPVQLLTVKEEELRKLEQNTHRTRWVVVVVGRESFVKDEHRLLERWLQRHGRLSYEHRSGQFDHHAHDVRVYKLQ